MQHGPTASKTNDEETAHHSPAEMVDYKTVRYNGEVTSITEIKKKAIEFSKWEFNVAATNA